MKASALYIIFLIISISLTYNEKLELLNQKTLYSRKQAANIGVLNRTLALGLVLYYLWANRELIKIADENNSDSSGLRTQMIASELSVLAAVIVLYVVAKDYNSSTYGVSQITNPEV
ncbi:MAG: hypothetical protein V8Q75_00705 [Bacilli bacterium]